MCPVQCVTYVSGRSYLLKTRALRAFLDVRIGRIVCTIIAHGLRTALGLRAIRQEKSRQTVQWQMQSAGLRDAPYEVDPEKELLDKASGASKPPQD
jgi:hypothetical protein